MSSCRLVVSGVTWAIRPHAATSAVSEKTPRTLRPRGNPISLAITFASALPRSLELGVQLSDESLGRLRALRHFCVVVGGRLRRHDLFRRLTLRDEPRDSIASRDDHVAMRRDGSLVDDLAVTR